MLLPLEPRLVLFPLSGLTLVYLCEGMHHQTAPSAPSNWQTWCMPGTGQLSSAEFSWTKHTPVAPSVGFSWAAWHTLVEDISNLILEERISVSSLIPQPQYTLKLRSDFCSSVPPLDSLGEDGSCLKNFLSSFNFRNSYFSPPPQPLFFLLQTVISRTSLEWKRIISYISTV